MAKSYGRGKGQSEPRTKWLSGTNITLAISLAGNLLTGIKMLPEFREALVNAGLLSEPTVQVRFASRHESLRTQGVVEVSAADEMFGDEAFDTDVLLPKRASYLAVPRLQYLALPFQKKFAYASNRQVIQIDDTFAVKGRIIRRGEDEGVSGAVISFDEVATVSDVTGAYVIEGLPPRTKYNVTVCPKGHDACTAEQLVRLTFAPSEGKRIHEWNAMIPRS